MDVSTNRNNCQLKHEGFFFPLSYHYFNKTTAIVKKKLARQVFVSHVGATLQDFQVEFRAGAARFPRCNHTICAFNAPISPFCWQMTKVKGRLPYCLSSYANWPVTDFRNEQTAPFLSTVASQFCLTYTNFQKFYLVCWQLKFELARITFLSP